MKKGFIANRGRLIVELIPDPKTTESGLHIPDNVQEKTAHRRVRILAVGSNELTSTGEPVPHIFRAGDIAIVSIYTQLESIVDLVVGIRFSEVIALETEADGN